MRLHLQLKSCLLYQNISFQTINDLMKLVHNTQFIIAFEITFEYSKEHMSGLNIYANVLPQHFNRVAIHFLMFSVVFKKKTIETQITLI